jgi:hypothetical protein
MGSKDNADIKYLPGLIGYWKLDEVLSIDSVLILTEIDAE